MRPRFLIIDGYNLLGAMGLPPSLIVGGGEGHRDQLIDRLGQYAQTMHCQITIIFDAWRQSGSTRQLQHHAGVTVIYSGKGERADQVIQQLIRGHGKDTAVVSSDHEILQVAKGCGAFVLTSPEFLTRLKMRGNTPKSGESLNRPRMGMTGDEEAPVTPKPKKGNPRKLPKKLRQRNRIMKKF